MNNDNLLIQQNFAELENYIQRYRYSPQVPFDYGKAIDQYKKQKQKFQAELTNQLAKAQNNKSKKLIDQEIKILMDGLISTSGQDSEVQKAQAEELLTDIDNQIAKAPNLDLQKLLQTIYDDMKAKEEKSKTGFKYKNFQQTYFERVKQALYEEITQTADLQSLILEMKNLHGDNEQMKQQIISYYASKAIDWFQPSSSMSHSRNSYINALKGYYREEAITKAFNKVLEKTKILKASNIAKEQQIEDIIFVIEEVDKLEGTYEGIANISTDFSAQLRAETKDLPTFGAQIKSFDLQNPNQNYFHLGSKAELRNRLIQEGPLGQTLAGNIAFMGTLKNIQLALGENNVIFVDGYNKYWMQNFITTFRKKGLWLQLSAHGKDWSRKVTESVVLYEYKRQTHKNKQLKQNNRRKS